MNAETAPATGILDALVAQSSGIVNALPALLGATLTVFLGWLLARLFRRATRGFADGLNRLLAHRFPSGRLAGMRVSPRLSAVVGAIGFWSILLLALTLAAQISGLRTLSGWLDRAAVYLPTLLVASLILLAGYLVSLYVRELFRRQAGATSARVAQSAVMLLASIMALGQIGIDVTLLVGVAIIAAAAVATTLGVTVALGARRYAGNLIGMRSVRDQIAPGQRLRVGGVTGQVLELTASQVTLETEDGKALVPGHYMSDEVTHILSPSTEEDADDE